MYPRTRLCMYSCCKLTIIKLTRWESFSERVCERSKRKWKIADRVFLMLVYASVEIFAFLVDNFNFAVQKTRIWVTIRAVCGGDTANAFIVFFISVSLNVDTIDARAFQISLAAGCIMIGSIYFANIQRVRINC